MAQPNDPGGAGSEDDGVGCKRRTVVVMAMIVIAVAAAFYFLGGLDLFVSRSDGGNAASENVTAPDRGNSSR